MRRRDFITLLGGAAAAWPFAARAQQAGIPVIGFLHAGSLEEQAEFFLAAMRRGLSDGGGYVEGKNISIEYRWAEGHADRLPALAADLVRRQVAVIVTGATPAALAAKAATATIPIVFILGADPVEIGLVASLGRPGGNITGITNLGNTLVAKRLNLLNELVSGGGPLGMLINPSNPNAVSDVKQAQSAAAALGHELFVTRAAMEGEIESAFSPLVEHRVRALFVDVDPSFTRWKYQLVAAASRHGIPASYPTREYAAAGGLMSYDSSPSESARQVGVYTARILRGAKPADLPVQQPTKFELVINLKTAKVLGVSVSSNMLAITDEVIE
jgi:putative ABC transport system substrate-binding protein